MNSMREFYSIHVSFVGLTKGSLAFVLFRHPKLKTSLWGGGGGVGGGGVIIQVIQVCASLNGRVFAP